MFEKSPEHTLASRRGALITIGLMTFGTEIIDTGALRSSALFKLRQEPSFGHRLGSVDAPVQGFGPAPGSALVLQPYIANMI